MARVITGGSPTPAAGEKVAQSHEAWIPSSWDSSVIKPRSPQASPPPTSQFPATMIAAQSLFLLCEMGMPPVECFLSTAAVKSHHEFRGRIPNGYDED